MHGFGSHTFSFINAKNERFWVKFHFRSQQGIKNLTDAEAEALIGKDRESHQRDLYDSIERGDYPKWTLLVQVMPEADAAKVPYNPFDLTKVWPHKDYPLIEVGVMELNRNPENFFAEVEQAAFNPANVVPGHRLLARQDAAGAAVQLRRRAALPARRQSPSIPVNAARCPVHSYHRDGAMRVDGNHGGTLGYEPNSYGEWQEQPDYREPPLGSDGAADHWNHREDTRLLLAARRAVPLDDADAAAGAVREHGALDRRRAAGDPAAPHRQLHEGRSRLRQGRRRCAGDRAAGRAQLGQPARLDSARGARYVPASMKSFRGKLAVVTGGGPGMGRELTRSSPARAVTWRSATSRPKT